MIIIDRIFWREGHHEVRKSLSLWHLLKNKSCPLSCLVGPECYSALEVKMGYGGQDELAGKSGTLNEKKVALGVVGHFPSHSVVEIPNILSASRHIILFFWILFG